MNSYLVSAALLLAAVGLVHTVLGEILIFSKLRTHGLVPTHGGNLLRERNVRILWATWHAVTALGWGMSLMLLQLASEAASAANLHTTLLAWAATSLALASALVLVGTRARHPGWLGLLGVALLIWLGMPD